MSNEQTKELDINCGFLPLLHFLVGGLRSSRCSSYAMYARMILHFWALLVLPLPAAPVCPHQRRLRGTGATLAACPAFPPAAGTNG